MKKFEFLIKHNKLVQLVYRVFFSFAFSVMSFFVPLKKNLILFSSFSGKKFNDSPKVLYEAILEKFGSQKFEMIWAFENPDQFANLRLKTVKINSFRYFRIAFRAKYWITNVNIERGLSFKKKGQIYLNTWHGTGPKTAGNAVNGRKDYNFKKVNYICADGEYLRDMFVRDFNAKKESVLLCGRPREDVLYKSDNQQSNETKQKYGIKDGDFVILYAPTWRETSGNDEIDHPDVQLHVLEILTAIPSAKILFREHSISSDVFRNGRFNNRFISATDEPEISSLFIVSDVLITDYSSSIVDFSILGKPFICFAPDYDDYIKKRALYFDLTKEYPFGVQKKTDEVVSVLKAILAGDSKHLSFLEFKKRYSTYGGNATETCLKKLFGE